MDSTDSVVMGGQKKRDTLAEMPRFGGRNEDGEVFPVWMKELCKKVKFDVGDIGVRIIKGEVKRGDHDVKEFFKAMHESETDYRKFVEKQKQRCKARGYYPSVTRTEQ